MFSRLFVAAGVMLVFGPTFAMVALTLIPGKENWPFSPVETRWPLSSEGTTSSKDVSSWSLNLWGLLARSTPNCTSSVEAYASPQAEMEEILPSWTSGHMSAPLASQATTNSRQSGASCITQKGSSQCTNKGIAVTLGRSTLWYFVLHSCATPFVATRVLSGTIACAYQIPLDLHGQPVKQP